MTDTDNGGTDMSTSTTIATEVEYRSDSRDYGYVYVGEDGNHGDTRLLFRGEEDCGQMTPVLFNTRGYPRASQPQVRAAYEALRSRCDELGWVVP